MRVVKGNDRTLTKVFYGSDELTASDVDGNVTVTVVDAQSNALTGASISGNNGSTGNYDFELTASEHTAELNILTVTWSAEVSSATQEHVDTVFVVGAHYFSLPQLDALNTGVTSNKSATYSEARDKVEAEVDRYLYTPIIQSYRTFTFLGNGLSKIVCPDVYLREIKYVSVDDTVVEDVSGFTVDGSLIDSQGTQTFTKNKICEVHYIVGLDYVPRDLSNAVAQWAVDFCTSDIDGNHSKIMSWENAFGSKTIYANSKADCPSGSSDVDTVLNRWRHRRYVA